jgi:hypothetical protein
MNEKLNRELNLIKEMMNISLNEALIPVENDVNLLYDKFFANTIK